MNRAIKAERERHHGSESGCLHAMTPCESRDLRREGRLISALLAADLGFGLAQLGLLIMTEERSMVALVAWMAGHPPVLAGMLLRLALLMVPYLLMQILCPLTPRRLKVVRLTVHVLLAAGVLRMYFAYLCSPLDLDTVTAVFAINGLWCICMAALLAYSINDKQKRAAA